MTTHGNGAGAHMERSGLVDMILGARTEQEISLAEAHAATWMRVNPDDMGIAMACEQLAMIREASSEGRPRAKDLLLNLVEEGEASREMRRLYEHKQREKRRFYTPEEEARLRELDDEISWKRYDEHPRLWNSEYYPLPFEEARECVHAFGFWNKVEWDEYVNTPMYCPTPRNLPERPSNIPYFPDEVYQDEWNDWSDWLGNDADQEWLDFEEAREYVRSLGLRDYWEYYEWAMSEARPPGIPLHPYLAYKEEGWYDLQDFLRGYRSYEEAREFVRSLGLRSAKEWHEYCSSGQKPDDIPKDPRKYYGDKWARR
jgi:hypothetical protein